MSNKHGEKLSRSELIKQIITLKNDDNFQICYDNDTYMFTFLTDKYPDLSNELLNITNNENFYNTNVQMSYLELYGFISLIEEKIKSGVNVLIPLVNKLKLCCSQKNEQFDAMTVDGKITFEHLDKLFKKDTKIITLKDGYQIGSIVISTRIYNSHMFKKYFIIKGNFIYSNGTSFKQYPREFYISEFAGLKNISELPVRPISDEELKKLTERGRKFQKYAIGHHFMNLKGNLTIGTGLFSYDICHNGRIIIDHTKGNTVGEDYYDDWSNSYVPKDTQTEINEDMLFTADCMFSIFSLNEKKWGVAYVEHISDITFNDDILNNLVLDDEHKEVLTALALHSDSGFKDIIQDKSGGTIVLLYGTPGTGKTLTAQAVAEILHKPLYSITVGELGTYASTLEENLSRILSLTKYWNAVVLIDEIDIFLEERTKGEIERNAMVGIFLRLLETYHGIMFLTTNRKATIDSAFNSRISVKIEYIDLDVASRCNIWNILLKYVKVSLSDDEINQLAKYDINGREIKNAIRLAQSLAKHKKCDVSIELLEKAINYSHEMTANIKSNQKVE